MYKSKQKPDTSKKHCQVGTRGDTYKWLLLVKSSEFERKSFLTIFWQGKYEARSVASISRCIKFKTSLYSSDDRSPKILHSSCWNIFTVFPSQFCSSAQVFLRKYVIKNIIQDQNEKGNNRKFGGLQNTHLEEIDGLFIVMWFHCWRTIQSGQWVPTLHQECVVETAVVHIMADRCYQQSLHLDNSALQWLHIKIIGCSD